MLYCCSSRVCRVHVLERPDSCNCSTDSSARGAKVVPELRIPSRTNSPRTSVAAILRCSWGVAGRCKHDSCGRILSSVHSKGQSIDAAVLIMALEMLWNAGVSTLVLPRPNHVIGQIGRWLWATKSSQMQLLCMTGAGQPVTNHFEAEQVTRLAKVPHLSS